jgi:hypothetical protein
VTVYRHAAAAAALSLLILAAAVPAGADEPFVQIRIPLGLTTDFTFARRAADGNLYVTVPSLRAHNPNANDFGPYDPSEFHLVVGDRTYLPVVRPGLGAIDLANAGIVPPNGTLVVTVTFEVPPATTVADLEFVPHWFDNNGASVAFCCLYQ